MPSDLAGPAPCEPDQPGPDVNAIRLHAQAALGTPRVHRLHQQSVGAADIQDRAVASDAFGDVLPRLAPLLLVTSETGALGRGWPR